MSGLRQRPTVAVLALAGVILIATCGMPEAQETRLPPGTPLPAYARRIHIGSHTVPAGPVLDSGRRKILLTGYWPPTNEMLRRFSTSPLQNPGAWIGSDWEQRGYDVYSYFAEFPGGLGRGQGDLEVDYQDTSQDFWQIVSMVRPVAIVSFGMGSRMNGWEVEWCFRNLGTWAGDYLSPWQPTPCPPDPSLPVDDRRYSSLPVKEIVAAVSRAPFPVDPFVDDKYFAGRFLCEFMGYHVTWYHALNSAPYVQDGILAAGFIHVSQSLGLANSIQATDITLRTVIDYLSQPLVAHARVITVQAGGALAFHLDAGPAHAARGYWLLGSVSGTRPGLAIPGSKAVLPLNWDPFTEVLVRLTNTSYCDRFLGALDAQGRGLAILRHRGAMPPSMAGAALDFAYVLFPGSGRGWFVSNPLEVTVVP